MKGRQAAFEEAIQEAPVIAAVKNDMGLAHALRSECAAVFILYGTILDIGQIVKRIKAAGKLAFVHADLIEGLSNRGERLQKRMGSSPPDPISSITRRNWD